MKTIGVAELKAHLSRELRRVAMGESILVTDHSRPIAVLRPLPSGLPLAQAATEPLKLPDVSPLIASDPLDYLEAERGDR
jgi:prevent-host-death family protein